MKAANTYGIDVTGPDETRYGFAIYLGTEWFAFTSHPRAREHPLLGTFPSAGMALQAIISYERKRKTRRLRRA